MMSVRRTKILLFSTLFPHKGEPTLGVFVENRLRNLLQREPTIDATIVAPVPWFPFKGKIWGGYGRAARADKMEIRDGLTIYHPRYLVIPKVGMLLTPFFLFLSAWLCLRRQARKGECFDLVDAHYLYPDVVAASRIAAKLEVPFVATARGSDVTQIALMEYPQKAILAALRKAAHVITVSSNLRDDLTAMGVDEDKVSVLRNGVDLKRFQQVERDKGRAAYPDGPIMLFAGWLIPRKRLDIVLEVTRLLPSINTVIVGDGPLLAECKENAKKLRISERVHFVGQKAPEQMPAYYSLADVLLLPSDREGWANVLLESMACGTPVVSRAIGSAPDLILEETAGRVVDSDKPEQIAKAVESLLKNLPERDAVRRYAMRYDWTETSEAQKRIFDAAIAASENVRE